MLARDQLESVLDSIATHRVAGLWARAVAHDYLAGPPPGAPPGTGPAPLWPGGPGLFGARYTPTGGAPSIYLAENSAVALLEVEAVVAVGGRELLTGARPFTVLQVDVRLDAVLDVCDSAIRSSLGTNLQELTGNWLLSSDPPTQLLGDALSSNPRFDGLRAPSAKDPTRAILVVFSDRLSRARGTFCEVSVGGLLNQRIPP